MAANTFTYRSWPEDVDWVESNLRRYAKALHGLEGHELEAFVGMMMAISYYESRGKWWAVNRRAYSDPYFQAAGVFQHMPKYWSALSRPAAGEPKVGKPQRVEATIAALEKAGVDEKWMKNPYILKPVPVYRLGKPLNTGILHRQANVATAVWLWGVQGYGAWSVTHELFKPEEFVAGETLWIPSSETYANVAVTNVRGKN